MCGKSCKREVAHLKGKDGTTNDVIDVVTNNEGRLLSGDFNLACQ